MTVTDEMVEAAMPFINITYADSEMKARAILEAALATIKPMTAREIDSMMQRGCIDDTVDLVEAVEYWHGIRG
jgi:hypothetical protein